MVARLPPLPELFNVGKLAHSKGADVHDLESMMEETEMDSITFAWDDLTETPPAKTV